MWVGQQLFSKSIAVLHVLHLRKKEVAVTQRDHAALLAAIVLVRVAENWTSTLLHGGHRSRLKEPQLSLEALQLRYIPESSSKSAGPKQQVSTLLFSTKKKKRPQ